MAKKKPTVDTIVPLDHHFLMISTAEWKASRDLSACLARGMSGGFPFTLYMVPTKLAEDGTMDYVIEWYQPKVPGCVVLNTFGFDKYITETA